MTGPEHYREAERLVEIVDEGRAVDTSLTVPELLAMAQVHATLALTAATAQPGAYFGDEGLARDQRQWSTAVRPAAKPQEVDEDA